MDGLSEDLQFETVLKNVHTGQAGREDFMFLQIRVLAHNSQGMMLIRAVVGIGDKDTAMGIIDVACPRVKSVCAEMARLSVFINDR